MSLDGQNTKEDSNLSSISPGTTSYSPPDSPQSSQLVAVEEETVLSIRTSTSTSHNNNNKTSITTVSVLPTSSIIVDTAKNNFFTSPSSQSQPKPSASTPSTSISVTSSTPRSLERRSTSVTSPPHSSISSPPTSSSERSPSFLSLSPSISPIRPQAYSITSPPAGGDGNVVTVIKVQSGARDKVDHDANAQSKVPEEVAITRINVTGGFNSETNGENHDSKSTRSSRSREGSQSQGRGSMRLGRGQVDENEDDGGDGSQSEVSSVVNNPSVISQAPDRYGFMGGEQYTHESEPDPPPEIIRRREMKWLTMLDKWDHYMKKDFKTVRSRCRKGIPRSVRGRAWYYLCGAAFIKKKNPDLFHTLCQQEGKPECVEDIKKDLHRQFPWHEIFAEEGHGQKDLFNVLKAHSILNAKDGYCQAQAPIAAILLMHMPSEDAFWCLVAICEKYLKGYYSPGMQQLQLDGDILFGLLKRVAPPVYKHLKKQKIDPVLYMTEWFLCAFTRTLPWASVLRVWDTFLCEGVKILFRVGLVLLKYTLGRSGVLKQCPNMYDTLMMVKNLPNYVTHEQFLVVQVYRLDMSDDQMRREHYKQVVKRKKAQQKLDAAKKQQEKSTSVIGSRQGVNNVSAATVHKSHETAL